MPEARSLSPDGDPSGPEHWRQVRRALTGHRPQLAALAARLYPGLRHAGTTDLLCRPDWIPAAPVPLDRLRLRWQDQPPTPAVTGTGAASAHVRPRDPAGRRYPSYARAVAALDRPALFVDRSCYRIVAASLAGPPELTFSHCRYFQAVDVGDAVAHELTAAWQRHGAATTMAGLPLRALAGDPGDLPRRTSTIAVTTLTLRRDGRGGASFILHWRDPAKVNHAGGMFQVMPAGIFQPTTEAASARPHDFDLWRCMAREFSEEFLGTPEDYPTTGGLLDYGRWPFFQRLTRARAAGKLTVHCLGVGADPVTLATDVLTVAVFDPDTFDAAFADLVTANAEGRVVTVNGSAGIPFTQENVARFGGGRERMQAAGAALLQLAWQHRARLLG